MSDLDNKLALIIEDIIEYSADDGPLKVGQLTFAEQIKQAFADAGYEKLHEKGAYDTMNEAVANMQKDWMTGQEWYDRFEKEFSKLTTENYMTAIYPHEALKAAQKASGLE